jgi:hypothetical protein
VIGLFPENPFYRINEIEKESVVEIFRRRHLGELRTFPFGLWTSF